MEKSPLRRLSAELREQIFQEILQPFSLVVVFSPTTTRPYTIPKYGASEKFGLLSTCRKLRRECLPIFLSRTQLILKTGLIHMNSGVQSAAHDRDESIPLDWLAVWVEMAGTITSQVTVELGSWSSWRTVASPELIAAMIQRFVAVIEGTNVKLTLVVSVEISPAWNTSPNLELRVPWWNIREGIESAQRGIQVKADWADKQNVSDRLGADVATLREKSTRLFDMLKRDLHPSYGPLQ